MRRRLLAIADPDFVNFSGGQPSEFGKTGLDALKIRLENLFGSFTAKLVVIVIEIRLQEDLAYDYGWHELTLTPKNSDQPMRRRDRYMDIRRRNKEGNWKLWMYMDNKDIADPLGFETGYLLGATTKKTILFFQRAAENRISLLVTGNTHPNCMRVAYSGLRELEELVRRRVAGLGESRRQAGKWRLGDRFFLSPAEQVHVRRGDCEETPDVARSR